MLWSVTHAVGQGPRPDELISVGKRDGGDHELIGRLLLSAKLRRGLSLRHTFLDKVSVSKNLCKSVAEWYSYCFANRWDIL